jgi:hypothetical protein
MISNILSAIPGKKYICLGALAAGGAVAYRNNLVSSDDIRNVVASALNKGGELLASLPGYAGSVVSNPGTTAVVAGLMAVPFIVPRLVGVCKSIGLNFSASSLEKEAENAQKEGQQILLLAKGLVDQARLIKNQPRTSVQQNPIEAAFTTAETAVAQLERHFNTLTTHCTNIKNHAGLVKNTSRAFDIRSASLNDAKAENGHISSHVSSLMARYKEVVQNTSTVKSLDQANRLAAISLRPRPPQEEPSWTQKKVSVLVDRASQLAEFVDQTIPSSTGKIITAAVPLVAGCWLFPLPTTVATAIGAIAHFSGVGEMARKYVVEFGRKEVLPPQVDFSNLPVYSSILKGKLVDEMKSTGSNPVLPRSLLDLDKRYSTLRSSIQLILNEPVLLNRLSTAIENRLSESDLFGDDIEQIVKRFPRLSLDEQTALYRIASILRKNHEVEGGKINQVDLENLIVNFDVLMQGGLPVGIFKDDKKINELIVLLDLKCKSRSAEGYEKIYKSLKNIFGKDKFPTNMDSVNPFNVVFELAKLISNVGEQSKDDVQEVGASVTNLSFTKAPELIITQVPKESTVLNLDSKTYKTSNGKNVKYDFTGVASWEGKVSTAHIKIKGKNDIFSPSWHHINFNRRVISNINKNDMQEKIGEFRLVILRKNNNRFF